MLKMRGFTLIELLIAVAVVGILTALAYPSYADYVRRGKITEAISGLSDMRVKMEQYFQDNRKYTGACAAGTSAPVPPDTKNFTFSCVIPDASTYTLTAQGIGSMSPFQYTVTQANAKKTLGLPPGWAGNNSDCWVLKKDGSC